MSGPAARARGLLARGGWIDVAALDGSYALRIGGDRRARAAMTLNEGTFRALIDSPGLKARPGGGWVERPTSAETVSYPPGAPGRIEGERAIMEPDGRLTLRRANLGESPVAWLARRKDVEGRPWLTPAEIAAAERLRLDAELARSGPSMTMRWDALPRTGSSGSSARVEPGDRALAAGRRAALALASIDPRTRALVEQVCIRQGSLQLAEQEAGCRRREGRAVLKAGLQTLARHYGIG
ncbi:DUF6456 domain-containing protein [Brevundimonas sp.]|uniref:DUF6456 domain-containing protein n=1 Tax=Brevundimonas sp. TaxID=1871086 RepID=UPI00286A2C33|nr:DUF6456 domain-containing protein [Brevundimonas sp.]